MLNRQATLAKLKNLQAKIRYESEEDEAVGEHWAEIESVINAITTNMSDEKIVEKAEWVSLESDLVYSQTIKGVVKWFNDAKGYGFITTPDVSEIFVHYSAITGDGFATLSEGQQVEFELVTGPKGPQAFNVVKGEIDPNYEFQFTNQDESEEE